MKRWQPPSESSSESLPEAKRRRVSYATFSKWKVDHDREWQTLTWLGCISALEQGKKLVLALCCEILVQYAVQFISVSTLDYRAVWWPIFHAPNASEWSNALILANLLFFLPASNAKVERVFSQVSIIKTNKRTLPQNDTLGDLLLLRCRS